jgi:hypothetical protein
MLKKSDDANSKNHKSLSLNEQDRWFICFDERLRKLEREISEIIEFNARKSLNS